MKYLLGVLAAVIIAAEGINKGLALSEKVRILEKTLYFLNDIRCLIEYKEETIYSIFLKYSESEKAFPEYIKKCKGYMENSDFPTAWNRAVSEIKIIDEKDRYCLYEFGDKLGQTEKSNQLRMIDYSISRLSQSLLEKREKEKTDKKLYYFIGISSGLVLMLLII